MGRVVFSLMVVCLGEEGSASVLTDHPPRIAAKRVVKFRVAKAAKDTILGVKK